MIAFESRLEKDFIYFLEFDKRITHYEEQPVTIEYTFQNKTHKYTPDFHVVFQGKNWLYECKPDKFLNQEDFLRKCHAAKNWCDEKGWTYEVAKESDIRSGCRLENIKFLTTFARHNAIPEIKAKIFGSLSIGDNPVKIFDLANSITSFDSKEVHSVIFQMAYFQELIMPLDSAKISMETVVRLA